MAFAVEIRVERYVCVSWFVRVTKGNFFDWQSMHSQTVSFDTFLNKKSFTFFMDDHFAAWAFYLVLF